MVVVVVIAVVVVATVVLDAVDTPTRRHFNDRPTVVHR